MGVVDQSAHIGNGPRQVENQCSELLDVFVDVRLDGCQLLFRFRQVQVQFRQVCLVFFQVENQFLQRRPVFHQVQVEWRQVHLITTEVQIESRHIPDDSAEVEFECRQVDVRFRQVHIEFSERVGILVQVLDDEHVRCGLRCRRVGDAVHRQFAGHAAGDVECQFPFR